MKPFDLEKAPKPKVVKEEIERFMKSITNIGLYNEIMKISQIEQSQVNMTHLDKESLERAQEILTEAGKLKLNSSFNRYSYGYGDNYYKKLQEED